MRVRDLGALVVVADTAEQPIAGSKAAAMLALLTINANQRVSVDALMDAAWGDQVTAGATSTLTSHIWRLRQLLEPGRDRRQPPSVLVNDSDGYRLVAGPSTVDSLQLVEASNEIKDLIAAGQAEAAVRRADAALALWRGTPYGAFAVADWAQAAVSRLREVAGQVREHRIAGLLATGALEAALRDLHPLVAAMPFRESLRALQMEALHRAGRTDQALHAYADTRRTLLDQVGIEPGRELQDLHSRILNNDPTLSRPPRRPVEDRGPVEVHLPAALTPLIGRDEALHQLIDLIHDRRLVTIIGAAGCGKTRIGIELARTVADRFPDGVWFVDLTAVSDPDLVIDVIVSTIGFAGTAGATPLQDLRRYLQQRRVMLVLDNCEHVLDSIDRIVRVILADPGTTPECCLLITSREPIGIDGETIWTLEPLAVPDQAGATDSPALDLFLQRLASAVPALILDDHARGRAVQICRAVDGLPLPLELAAARALSHSLDEIAMQAEVDPGRLSRAGRGPHDHRATVRSAIEWSHRLLSPAEQTAHRRLSVLPGAFTSGPARAVLGDVAEDGELVDTDDLLAKLVRRSMLASEGPRGPNRPTAFRQLATVRSHARYALAGADETALSTDRRDAWTADLLTTQPPLGARAEIEWYQAIDDDYPSVRATLVRRLIEEPSTEGGRLACRLTYYWYYRERLVEATRWLQLGAEILRTGDPTDALLADLHLGSTQALQGRLDLVRPVLTGLDARVRDTPSTRLIEAGEGLVGLAMAMYTRDEYGLLAELSHLLSWVAESAGGDHLAMLADTVRCCALVFADQPEVAVQLALSVQSRAESDNNLMASWMSTAPLIITALHERRPQDGIRWVDRCLSLSRQVGTGSIGMFAETRANFAAELGDYHQAAQTYAASRIATRRAGMVWPNREHTHAFLAATRDRLTRADYERAWRAGERLNVTDLFGIHSPTGGHSDRTPAA